MIITVYHNYYKPLLYRLRPSILRTIREARQSFIEEKREEVNKWLQNYKSIISPELFDYMGNILRKKHYTFLRLGKRINKIHDKAFGSLIVVPENKILPQIEKSAVNIHNERCMEACMIRGNFLLGLENILEMNIINGKKAI